MDFKKHCICEFGKYLESRGYYVLANYMTPRTHEEIALGTSDNLHGIHKVFFSNRAIAKVTNKYGCTHTISSNQEN